MSSLSQVSERRNVLGKSRAMLTQQRGGASAGMQAPPVSTGVSGAGTGVCGAGTLKGEVQMVDSTVRPANLQLLNTALGPAAPTLPLP